VSHSGHQIDRYRDPGQTATLARTGLRLYAEGCFGQWSSLPEGSNATVAMDQLDAHLDRGWDLVSKGDFKGARAAARRALQANKGAPEAHHLLGFVAQHEGDADEALEHYREAISIDDGYIDAYLDAAEVLIHPMAEFDEAIAMCDEVLEFAETDDVIVDALLLKFDALLAKEDREEAAKVLDALPKGPFANPQQTFLVGRALFEAKRAKDALPLLESAVQSDADNADAQYYLGLASDELGDRRRATMAFLECRELDLRAPPAPWSLERVTFQRTVEKAVSRLSPTMLAQFKDAMVLVSDVPGMEIIADGVDPRAGVLFDGVAERGGPPPIAARVFVYQRNIERAVGGFEQLEDEIVGQIEEELEQLMNEPDATVEVGALPSKSPSRVR
jgi:tetratricopeptide (TPR) repeat protein